MLFKSALLLGAAGLALVQGRTCGTGRNHKHRETATKLAAKEAKASKLNSFSARYSNSSSTDQSSIHVDVYMHSVSATNKGLLNDQDFKKQFDVIADRFEPYDITFDLKDTSRTVNPRWANGTKEIAMKSKLRKGDYRALNLYFTDYVVDESLGDDDLLGVCYYPTDAPGDSEDFIKDGCILLSSTIPGGSSEFYDQGITTVHEIGHWFGLEHTFGDGDGELEDGCSGPGDGVLDTPASANATEGCPTDRNSCPDKPGMDPVHNYMDYSDDMCLNEFTPGQIKRIRGFWSVYRESWPDVLTLP